METSIDRIRAKIAELEARIADLRIAERELEALDAAPALRTKPKAKAKRKPTTDDASKAPQTVGGAIAEVLSRSGALDDEKARHGQERRRQMDAAKSARQARRRLTASLLAHIQDTEKCRNKNKGRTGREDGAFCPRSIAMSNMPTIIGVP